MTIKTIFAAAITALSITTTQADEHEITASNVLEHEDKETIEFQNVPIGMENGISESEFLKFVIERKLTPIARGEDSVDIFNAITTYTNYFFANEETREWIIASNSINEKLYIAQWGHEYNAMLDHVGTTPASFLSSPPDFASLCAEYEYDVGNNTTLSFEGVNAVGNYVALFTEPVTSNKATWILLEREFDGHDCAVINGINFEKADILVTSPNKRMSPKIAQSGVNPQTFPSP